MIIPVLIDEEIKEARIEIRHIESESLVSVIEVLSPTNKIKGSQGRVSFMEKRQDIWQSKVHWVEIDLLRAGEPSIVHPPLVPSDYRILVCRGGHYGRGRYGPFSVRQPLPAIKIPLRQPDPDMTLDLGAVFRETYEHGAYERSVDYRHEPDPPLNPEDRAWADKLLRAKKQRR
jgi:hypothetical protein